MTRRFCAKSSVPEEVDLKTGNLGIRILIAVGLLLLLFVLFNSGVLKKIGKPDEAKDYSWLLTQLSDPKKAETIKAIIPKAGGGLIGFSGSSDYLKKMIKSGIIILFTLRFYLGNHLRM